MCYDGTSYFNAILTLRWGFREKVRLSKRKIKMNLLCKQSSFHTRVVVVCLNFVVARIIISFTAFSSLSPMSHIFTPLFDEDM